MKKVFLGGTCNDSKWRDVIIPYLKIDFFNPVVEDWTEEDYKNELKERESCDYCLYVITPKMEGSYSIAEVVDDSNKRPDKTIFTFIDRDGKQEFSPSQLKSLDKVGVMVESNGGQYLKTLTEVVKYLNKSNPK
jgi:hypothetical protein